MHLRGLQPFQSTLRRTERHVHSGLLGSGITFQSTLRRTERHHQIYNPVKLVLFQSTLRRTERHSSVYDALPPMAISIHAPTNGATSSAVCSIEVVHFNPRSDERSDGTSTAEGYDVIISIHAPTNGATFRLLTAEPFYPFQSTLRRTERRP